MTCDYLTSGTSTQRRLNGCGSGIPARVTDIPRRSWRGSRRLLASEILVTLDRKAQQTTTTTTHSTNSFNSRVTSSSTSYPTDIAPRSSSCSPATLSQHTRLLPTYPHSLPRRSFFYLVARACSNVPNYHYWPVTSYQSPSNPFGRNEDRPSSLHRVIPLSTITY